jgi:hypothetical protein
MKNPNANIFLIFFTEQSGKGIKIRVLNHDGSYKRTKRFLWRKHGYKNLKIFSYLYRKDIPKACFFRTLNLKRISSMKMKKEEESSRAEATVNKTDSTTSHGGNKVLPITHEAPLPTSAGKKDQCDKKKPISRMKELLRWAASAKTEKGGKFYGKKVMILFQPFNLLNLSFSFVLPYFCFVLFSLFLFYVIFSFSSIKNKQKVPAPPLIHRCKRSKNSKVWTF